MKCNHCGTKLKKGIEVCPTCGRVNRARTVHKNRTAIIVACIVAVLLMIAFLVALLLPSRYESLTKKASEAFDNGHYKKTVELCSEALKENRQGEEAYVLRANSYYEMEKYEDAIKDYEKSVSLGVDGLYGKLGCSYKEVGELDKAAECMNKHLESYDDCDVEIYLRLIEVYDQQCKYKEGRDIKAKGYEKTGDDRLRIISFSEEEAKEIGGVFVLSGDRFYMPCIGGRQRNEYRRDKYRYTDPNNEDIPVLCEGDKLVFFSENDLEDSYPVYRVSRTAYTFPAHFGDPNNYTGGGIYGNVINLKSFDFTEMKVGVNEYGENYRIEAIESINGKSYEEFYRQNVPVEDVAELKEGEEVTFTYHSGTEYKKQTETADLKCYLVGDELSLTGSLSDGAYAVFDTSGLSAGTYIMPFEMSKKTIIYFSDISDFIFKVAE